MDRNPGDAPPTRARVPRGRPGEGMAGRGNASSGIAPPPRPADTAGLSIEPDRERGAGLNVFQLARLRASLKPFRLHWFPRLRSTNDHAAELRRTGGLYAPAIV